MAGFRRDFGAGDFRSKLVGALRDEQMKRQKLLYLEATSWTPMFMQEPHREEQVQAGPAAHRQPPREALRRDPEYAGQLHGGRFLLCRRRHAGARAHQGPMPRCLRTDGVNIEGAPI